MTKGDVDALCVLLARLSREQWLKVRHVVDDAYDSVREEFYEAHRDEWDEHGKSPEWFSKRLAVLEED